MTEPPPAPDPGPAVAADARRERWWLAAGAVAGVAVVAMAVVAVLLVGNSRGVPPSAPLGVPSISATPPAARIAAYRDESLHAAESVVVELNTLDHRTAQRDLDRWELAATGPLLDELMAKRKQTASEAAQRGTVTTARVLAAAVSSVSVDPPAVDVLVSLEVTVGGRGESTVKQVRQKLTMTQTDQGWKPSAMVTVEPAP